MSGSDQVECITQHWKTVEGVVGTRKPPTLISITRDAVHELRRGEWQKVKRSR